MAASDIILQVARAARFQARCDYFAVKAAIALANDVSPTPDQLRFAKASIGGALDLQRVALTVLTNPTIAQTVQTTGDPEGSAVPDADIEFAVASVAPTIGKAIA